MHDSRAAILTMFALAALAPAAAGAQSTLDEGTFRILVGGREVGRETFSIKQSGAGAEAVVVAQGRVTLSSQDLTSSLELRGAGLRPASYRMQVEGDGSQRIAGRVIGGRFSEQIASGSGEQLREYLASDGAIVADDGVAHQYFFVARRALEGQTSVPLLVPRQSKQVMATLRLVGPERIEAGGSAVQARHIVVQPRTGDARDIWVDNRGRVLRVEIKARDYTAVRATLPG